MVLEKLQETLNMQNSMYENAHQSSLEAEGRMQSRYDSTKEEMAYLANSYQNSMQRTMESIVFFEKYKLIEDIPSQHIQLGSIVRVEEDNDCETYFISEKSGGLKVDLEEEVIFVITPSSPIGQILLGQKSGSDISISTPGGNRRLKILEVL
jgi:transcription elongation GreA/GreB family factor